MDDNLTKQASYVLKEEGVDETAAKLRRLGEANEKTARQAEILSRQQTLQEASVTRLGSKLETLARKYDPIYKAQREAERAEGLVAAAQNRGVEVTDAASRALEVARARHRQLAEAAQQSNNSIAGAGDSVALFKERIDKIEQFAWNNTGFSANEIERVTLPLKTLASTVGVLPTVGVAAFAAVAAAVAALAVRAYNTSVAAQQLADNLSLSGQVNAFQRQSASAQQLAEQMTRISSAWDLIGHGAALPTEEVKKFGAELAKLPGVTGEMASSFVELARSERYAFGSEGVDMVQGLIAALRQPEQALQALVSGNLGLTAAQRQAAQSALDSGNSQRQASTYFRLVTDDFIRQKAESILLDAAHSSLNSTVRALAEESLNAARANGDFESALERVALAGNSAAQKLLGTVSAIRSIRTEMARGLSGVELSNALQNQLDKYDSIGVKVRSSKGEFEQSTAVVTDLETKLANAAANLNRIKAAGEDNTSEFRQANDQIKELTAQLEKARTVSSFAKSAYQTALDEQAGGTAKDRAFTQIDRLHDTDKDEVTRAREKIAEIERAITEISETETAKRRDLESDLADQRKSLADEELKVEVARIDAEIAKEEQGTARKKELARQKFELQTRGVAPNSADYIGKQSELRGILDEEPKKSAGERAPRKQSSDEVERYVRSLDKENATLLAEADAQGKSNVEKEKAVDLARAEAAARERGTPLTEAEIAQVERLAEATARAKERKEEWTKTQTAAREQAQFFGNVAYDAIGKLAEPGAKFDDVLKSIVKSLEQAALKAALLGEGPLAGLFGTQGANGAGGGLIGGLANWLGGLFGSNSRSIATMAQGGYGPDMPIGMNAGGTDFWRGGLTWVGERGPELVHLPRGSAVMPNAQSLAYARSLASASNENRGVTVAAPVTVNLIGAPAGAKVEQTTDSRGGRRVDVVFDERIATAQASPQGVATSRALYGLKPQIARR